MRIVLSKNITFLFFLMTLFNSIAKSQIENKFNFNFEDYEVENELPEGWFTWGNHIISIDTNSNNGKWAGKITSTDNGKFGTIAFKIPANYKGKTIQLEGYMKTKKIMDGFAGLFLRIDGNGKTLAFDNMLGRKIDGTNDWKKYELNILYPEGAEKIYVGGILVGQGEAWFDNLVLSIDRKDVQTLEETENAVKAYLDHEFDTGSKVEFPNIDEKIISNLELFGKIWGLLKYNHPVINKGDYNWDYELFRVLPRYLSSENINQRDSILIEWIKSYGNIEVCDSCKESSPKAFLTPDLTWIENRDLGSNLKETLFHIYKNRYQGEHFYVSSKRAGNPLFLHETSYKNMSSYPDPGYRLLSLYRYWNIINYFFPYKHLTDKNWNDIMKEYISIFINAKDEMEYEVAVLKLINDINDSHAFLTEGFDKINDSRGKYYPPFQVKFIEKKLVVTDYYNLDLIDKSDDLSVGDVITHINNISVENLVDSLYKYYPASNEASKMRNVSKDILRSSTNHIQIKYLSNGEEINKELTLYPKDSLKFEAQNEKNVLESYRVLNKKIGYINAGLIKSEEIPKMEKKFKKMKGIIIDIRNYPSDNITYRLSSYFVDKPTPFAKFTKANINNLGQFDFTKEYYIPGSTEVYKGKLIVLVNEKTQSNAEFTTMALKAGNNTTIIGSTTAGADGNVSEIKLPGGIKTKISGIGVYYPDGTETQRIGIVPDIEVHPTIDGIKKGKDELLEKAIELIKQ